jgi:hypothetical protein
MTRRHTKTASVRTPGIGLAVALVDLRIAHKAGRSVKLPSRPLAEGDGTWRMFAPAVYRKVTLTGQVGSLGVQAGQLLGGYCWSRHVR